MTIILICLAVLGAGMLVARVAYETGKMSGEEATRSIAHNALREIEFRDRIRSDSFSNRTVTRSGAKNTGRSRVRRMKTRK